MASSLTLQGHDETTLTLDHLGNHVVNETVLVPDVLGLELLLVGGLVDLLEDILEATIVPLQDGVLGAHVERETLKQGHLETGMGEAADRLVGVVLGLGNTTALEVVDIDGLGLATLRGVDELQLAGSGNDTVLGTVLVTEGVTTDDDGLVPAGDETRDAGDDDGLTEDGTVAARGMGLAIEHRGGV